MHGPYHRSHFPPSSSFSNNQLFFHPTHALVLGFQPGVRVSQAPRVTMLQPPGCAGRRDLSTSLTLRSHMSTGPALGGALLHPLTPFQPNTKEDARMTRTVTHGLAVLPCKDSTQPQPGNPKHQLQGTGQQDTFHLMQWWHKGP